MYGQDIHIQEELSDDELRIMNHCKSVIGREIEKKLSENSVITDLPHLINKSILSYNNSTSIRLQKVRHLYILKHSEPVCTPVMEESPIIENEEENDISVEDDSITSNNDVSNEQNCSYSSSQPKKRSLRTLTANETNLLNPPQKKSKFPESKDTDEDDDVSSDGSIDNPGEEVNVDDDGSYHGSVHSDSETELEEEEPVAKSTIVRVKRTAGKTPRRSVVSDAAKNRGTFEKKDDPSLMSEILNHQKKN